MRSSKPRKSLLALTAAAATAIAVAVGTGSSPASAQDLVIETGGVAFGDPGTRIEVANQPVPEELVGADCVVTLATGNNESVHPGNNLHITSGETTAELRDVESTPDAVDIVDGTVTLGSDPIVIELEFGPDGVTSGGLQLAFDCTAPAPEPPAPEPEPEEPEFAG